jgi:hypothetical protein
MEVNMATEKSAVTPERFASGLSYKDYIAQISVNKDRFDEFYKTGQLSTDDAAFFRRAAGLPNGPAKMLVLGEDWCPDVFRGLPAMARIAEAAGIELRVFPRDKNLDIMNEFLNEGKYQSMPTCVFYTGDLKYIAFWIERPSQANEERIQIEAQVKKQMPAANEQEMRAVVRERTQTRYLAWQQATIKEMRKLLEGKLGIYNA